MLRNEGDRLRRVVVSSPGEAFVGISDLSAHNFGQQPDGRLAVDQHDLMKSTITAFGAEIVDLPELSGHPNSVFTRDTALSTPDGFVRLRLGLPTREEEDRWMADGLEALGEPMVGEIEAPGTVEGGDVVLAGSVTFVGESIRTNRSGIDQLADILTPMGFEVRVIRLPDSILHLDKVLLTIGPETLLFCPDFVDEGDLDGFETIAIPYGSTSTANVINLGDSELIVNRSNRGVIERLAGTKYTVHDLDLSEYAKGTGGPNCLVMPVDRG
ncbi:MAG: arginine deiminase family protein [Actinomycetota bacterium]|nr:arginine deiminase family protein [Actinomycetota bacterium]